MKKIVLKFELHDDKAKQKAFKKVSTLSGIDSIAMDMKERKMTVIGTVDPIRVVSKLRKHWPSTTITLVEAAKEPEKEKKEGVEKKEEEPKKGEENALEEAKKDDEVKKKGEEPKKEEEAKNKEEEDEDEDDDEEKIKPIDPYMLELVKANHRAYYNNHHLSTYYYAQSMEENPNTCVIC